MAVKKRRFNPLVSKSLIFIPLTLFIISSIGALYVLSLFRFATYSGLIIPKKFIEVRAEVNSKIKHNYVVDGQQVTNGQLMLELDDESIALDLQRLDISLQKKRKQLSIAKEKLALINEKTRLTGVQKKRDLEQKEKLFDEELISWTELQLKKEDMEHFNIDNQLSINDLESMITGLEIEIENLEAKKMEDQNFVKKSTIYATTNGIVVLRNINTRNNVNSPDILFSASVDYQLEGKAVQNTEVLYTIVHDSDLYARFEIPESDISKIDDDTEYAITIKSLPVNYFGSFKAKLEKINYSAVDGKFLGLAKLIIDPKDEEVIKDIKNRIYGSGCTVKVQLSHKNWFMQMFFK